MADFYQRMTEVAQKLIKLRGAPAILKQIRQEVPDPDRPWDPVPAPTPVELNVVIAFLPVDRYAWETMRLRKDTDITEGHLMGYMAGPSPRPNLKDVVIRDGQQLTIDDYVNINPDGRDVIYILLLRQ